MRSLIVIICLATIAMASEFIPFQDIQQLAERFVDQRFGDHYFESSIAYYGYDEQPNAYAMVFKNHDNEPLTIVMGARYTSSPVGEIIKALPRCQSQSEKLAKIINRQGIGTPRFVRNYYFGPGEEYCGFISQNGEYLINTGTFKIIEKDMLIGRQPAADPELEKLTREKWNKYFKCDNFASRDSNYVPGVPWIDWVYGCSPTAASMLFWYWDSRGYGRLVDYFYLHWDYPEGEWNDCANVNRELALAMYTDSMTGGTTINNIRNGMITTANSYNGYSFNGSTSPQGGSYNQWNFTWVKQEIDAARPFHWNVLYYYYSGQFINHSITGVGYLTVPGDSFVQVHTTWDGNEPHWALWTYYQGTYSYDYVVTLIPGGSINDNLFLDWPRGGNVYAPQILFKNIKYTLRWSSVGSNINRVKIWSSRGRDGTAYDSLQWTLIQNNASNTGSYVYTIPGGADTFRINISGMNSSNVRLGADGSFGRCNPITLSHSAGIDLIGHLPTEDGYTRDIVRYGDYLYVVDGENGLLIADISDSTLPVLVGALAIPGNSMCIALSHPYVYVGTQGNMVYAVSVSDPQNPSQVGSISLGDQVLDILVSGNYAYAAARGQGLIIVNITNPASPSITGQYNTPGFAYDIDKDGNFVYVADATQGVRIINVSNPSSPVETGYNNTNGVTYGLTKVGNYLYAADGTAGLKVFDATSTDTLILLGSFDTPTTATKVQFLNNVVFVADGNFGGIRAISVANPSNPSEVGYIEGRGSAGNIQLDGSLVYLADGVCGTLIINQTLTCIAENRSTAANTGFSISPSHVKLNGLIAIRMSHDHAAVTSVDLYDASGRLIDNIYKGLVRAGYTELSWPVRNLPAGVYFVEMKTRDVQMVEKLLIIK